MGINQLLNKYYIAGSRGYWYFDFELADNIQINGGLFHRKSDARALLRDKVSAYITDPIVAKKYLEMLTST